MAGRSIPAPHLLDQLNDAVIVTDLYLHIHSWNRAAASLYGWSTADVMGRSAQEVLALRHYPDLTPTADLRTLVDPTGQWRGRVSAAHRAGHDLVLDTTVRLLQDERGVPCGISVIQRDITHEE